MMKPLGNYVISVCFAIILGVAAQMLAPSEKYRGIMRMVSGVFILYALISPLGKILNFKLPTFDAGVLESRCDFDYYEKNAEEAFDKALFSSASRASEKEIEAAASVLGAAGASARVSIDGDTVSIEVSGVPPDKRGKIHDYIKSSFNTEPVITE